VVEPFEQDLVGELVDRAGPSGEGEPPVAQVDVVELGGDDGGLAGSVDRGQDQDEAGDGDGGGLHGSVEIALVKRLGDAVGVLTDLDARSTPQARQSTQLPTPGRTLCGGISDRRQRASVPALGRHRRSARRDKVKYKDQGGKDVEWETPGNAGPPFEYYKFGQGEHQNQSKKAELVALCKVAMENYPGLGGDDGVLRQINLLTEV
jgi:hypothetical protein